MSGEYERLKMWLEELFGTHIMSQSVAIEDGLAVVEEDVDIAPETSVILGDIYDMLGISQAPWIIEEDLGDKRIVKFPVGV